MLAQGNEKQCCKCKEVKPLKAYNKDRTTKDGLQARCRQCQKAWYYANREKTRQARERWRSANPEKAREYSRRWYKKNKKKVLEAQRQRRRRAREEAQR